MLHCDKVIFRSYPSYLSPTPSDSSDGEDPFPPILPGQGDGPALDIGTAGKAHAPGGSGFNVDTSVAGGHRLKGLKGRNANPRLTGLAGL